MQMVTTKNTDDVLIISTLPNDEQNILIAGTIPSTAEEEELLETVRLVIKRYQDEGAINWSS